MQRVVVHVGELFLKLFLRGVACSETLDRSTVVEVLEDLVYKALTFIIRVSCVNDGICFFEKLSYLVKPLLGVA